MTAQTAQEWTVRLMPDDPSLVTVDLYPGERGNIAFVADTIEFAVDGGDSARLRILGNALFTNRRAGVVYVDGSPDASLRYACPAWAKDAVRMCVPAEFHHLLETP